MRWLEVPLLEKELKEKIPVSYTHLLLNDFLYEAIYIPDGVEPPSKSIINCPELQEYVFEFGKRKDDRALVCLLYTSCESKCPPCTWQSNQFDKHIKVSLLR